jgi:hypothetical protein
MVTNLGSLLFYLVLNVLSCFRQKLALKIKASEGVKVTNLG